MTSNTFGVVACYGLQRVLGKMLHTNIQTINNQSALLKYLLLRFYWNVNINSLVMRNIDNHLENIMF